MVLVGHGCGGVRVAPPPLADKPLLQSNRNLYYESTHVFNLLQLFQAVKYGFVKLKQLACKE